MEVQKRVNLLLVFIGAISLSIFGFSKLNLDEKSPISLFNNGTLAKYDDKGDACLVEKQKNNTALFVSCGGFLE